MDYSPPPVSAIPLFDAYAPAEVAVRVRDIGVVKARAPLLTLIALAVLAGAFISLGALFYSISITPGPGAGSMHFGLSRFAGGIAFSLGLVLVVVGGAELFTGNNLLAMAWAANRVTTAQVVRNWSWVYLGNLMGALGTALFVFVAGIHTLDDGSVGETMLRIARGKVTLDPIAAIARGMLCNVLVCLAVWLCMAARSVTDKIMAVVFPISAFVACGFEHSVANMFFLPLGMVLAATSGVPISFADTVHNLFYVTVGNILGGTVLVALVYWFVYLREDHKGRHKGDGG